MAGTLSQLGNIFGDVAIKAAVRVASTASNIVLNGLQTIDGVAVNAGDRVLATAQSDPTTNGIWLASTGPWTRTADATKNTDFIDGSLVPVARGAGNAGQMFQLQCTDSPIVIGTSQLVFVSQAAVASAQQTATSATSLAVGTGSKTFAIAAGKAFSALQYVVAFETSNPANAMVGQISSYSGTSLVVGVNATGGSGTHADWTIALVNSPASAGVVPPIGTGNVTGPGSSTAGHLATFADGSGKLLSDPGIAAGVLAGRNTLLYGDAGTATIPASALSPGSAPLPFVGAQPADNLRISNDATNPTRDIDLSIGRVRDDSDVTNLHLAAAMVKRLDTAFAAGGAAGSPQGACDSGSKGASQTWHIFLIAKRGLNASQFSRTSNVATVTSAAHGLGVGGTCRITAVGSAVDALAPITAVTTNTVSYANSGPDVAATACAGFVDGYDILASQSYSAPTLPSGWTVKQCLGSVLTDGSGNIRPFLQVGDLFMLTTPIQEFSSAIGTSQLNVLLTGVPNGRIVEAMVQATVFASGDTAVDARIFSPLLTNTAPDITSNGFSSFGMGGVATNALVAGTVRTLTNTARQISIMAGRGETATIVSIGWRDLVRRLF